jgi:GAF domain-containing protein
MKQFITKFLLFTFVVPLTLFAGWLFFADRHIDSALRAALNHIVLKVTESFADAAPEEMSKGNIKLILSGLEQNPEIVTFSFLSKDKSVNFSEGIRKRDRVLWSLHLIYHIKDHLSNTVAWLKIWPSPELFFHVVNWELLFISLVSTFIISVLIILYFLSYSVFRPLDALEKLIVSMESGNQTDAMFFSKYGGVWQNMHKGLKKLNSKVLDINTTVQLLFSVSKALTSQVDMSQIFNVIMLIIQKKFSGAMCAVILPAEDGALRVIAKLGFSNALTKSIKIESGNPVIDAYTLVKTVKIDTLSTVDEEKFKDFISEGVKSQMNVPLIDESNAALGVLSVSSKEENVFDISLSETILVVAKYLSIALRNAKLYDKVQEHSRQLETEVATTSNQLLQANAYLISKVRDIKALSDISSFAADKFDVYSIAGYVHKKIMELTSAEAVCTLLTEDGYNYSVVDTGVGVPEDILKTKLNKDNTKFINRLIEDKKIIALNSNDEIKEEAPEALAYGRISSAVYVPLISKGELTGIIAILNKFAMTISENDIKLIDHIGVIFLGILEKIRIYASLENEVKKLSYLQQISSAMSSEPDVSKVLEKIVSVTKDALNADLCAIALLDEQTNTLVTQRGAYFTGGAGEVMTVTPIDDDKSVSAAVFRKGASFITENSETDPNIKLGNMKRWDIKSAMIVPLRDGKKTIGVLRVGSHEAFKYKEGDLSFLETIADQSAVIIRNANLFKR